MPAGWAFSIWGIIFSLLGVFTVYQALPTSWVPGRNNTLIFEDIGYQFFINMMVLSLWPILFWFNNAAGFAISLVAILFVLSSDWYMLLMSQKANVNWVEWISIRAQFSINSGWVTAATILNVSLMLKAMGLAAPNIPSEYEEYMTVGVLWVALVIYNSASYVERNPLYGSIFIWVLLAIRSEILTNKAQYTMIEENLTALLIIHGISMVSLWTWLGSE